MKVLVTWVFVRVFVVLSLLRLLGVLCFNKEELAYREKSKLANKAEAYCMIYHSQLKPVLSVVLLRNMTSGPFFAPAVSAFLTPLTKAFISPNLGQKGTFKKNPAYGRHQLTRPMRIGGPIQI